MKTFIAALAVLVIALCAVTAGIAYSYKEGCYVPSIKWEAEA